MGKLTIKKIKDHYGIFCGDNLLSTGDTYEECEEDLKEMENHSDCSLNKEKNDVEVKANTENLSPVKIAESSEDNYDELADLIQESYDNGDITYDEAVELNDAVYTVEGANTDINNEFKDFKKSYKEHMASYKKKVKNKDYSGAKKELSIVESDLNRTKAMIKSIDANSISTTIIADILECLKTIGIALLASLIPFNNVSLGTKTSTIDTVSSDGSSTASITVSTPKVQINLAATIKEIIDLISSVKQISKDAKNKDITAQSFNIFRNKILTLIDHYEKIIKDSKKEIDNISKASHAIKESADDSYDEAVETIESVKPIIAEVSGSFAYEAMLDSINNKYNNGEITYEMASELNDKAYDKYVTEGANIDITKVFAKNMKELLKLKKAYKKAIKAKDYSKAKKQISDIDKLLDDTISKIKGISGGAGSAALGYVATFAYSFVKTTIPMLGIGFPSGFIGGVLIGKGVDKLSLELAGFTATSKAMPKVPKALFAGTGIIAAGGLLTNVITTIIVAIDVIKDISETVDRIKKEKDITPDTFNFYKNRILRDLKNIKAQFKEASKNLDAAEKAEKDAKKDTELKN